MILEVPNYTNIVDRTTPVLRIIEKDSDNCNINLDF